MNILYSYEKQNDIAYARDLFNTISKQFHFWKTLLKIEDLSKREEEIDLILSAADYKKDLSALFKEKKYIHTILSNISEIDSLVSDNSSILECLNDADFFELFQDNLIHIHDQMDILYLNNLSQLEQAKNYCYIQFRSSTGGTESENLTDMMFKNYLKMFEDKNINCEIIDHEVSGNNLLKNGIIKVEAKYAYGRFYTEKGVHRFTRMSPYGNGKLHTSFVFVDVYPHIDYETQTNINKNDLRIDNFRGSGAGGQHKNVTDSAVRITHIPTGIIVKIESERSQHKNKRTALDILAVKLLELEKNKQKECNNKNKGKNDIQDWGRQIRTYAIEQNRIKDHRTQFEMNCDINSYFNNLFDFIIKNNVDISIK